MNHCYFGCFSLLLLMAGCGGAAQPTLPVTQTATPQIVLEKPVSHDKFKLKSEDKLFIVGYVDHSTWHPSLITVEIFMDQKANIIWSSKGQRPKSDGLGARRPFEVEFAMPSRLGKYFVRASLQGPEPTDRVTSEMIEIEITK